MLGKTGMSHHATSNTLIFTIALLQLEQLVGLLDFFLNFIFAAEKSFKLRCGLYGTPRGYLNFYFFFFPTLASIFSEKVKRKVNKAAWTGISLMPSPPHFWSHKLTQKGGF